MARRAFLHVGTMKSATSYLQALFDRNRDRLGEHGVLWQSARLNQYAFLEHNRSEMFPPDAKGSWRRLLAEVHATPGDVLLSMELLARLPEPRARAVVEAIGAEETHVLVTARDITRVAPSHWQEIVQNRDTTPWAEWIGTVCANDPRTDEPIPFWQNHYLPGIVESWSAATDPARVHLVTVPRSGGDPDEVWRRFASVLGVPAGDFEAPEFGNTAIGASSAELMRRLNLRLGQDVDFQTYRWGFKSALAKQTLAPRAAGEPRIGLAPDQHRQLRAVALTSVERLEGAGVRVVGDLADLVPPEEAPHPPYDPGTAADAELLEAALDGLVGLGLAASRFRQQRDRLRRLKKVPEGDLEVVAAPRSRDALDRWRHRGRAAAARVLRRR